MHCMKCVFHLPSLHFMQCHITQWMAHADDFNLLLCHCRSPGNLNTPPQSHTQSKKTIWLETMQHYLLKQVCSCLCQSSPAQTYYFRICWPLRHKIMLFPSICSRVKGDALPAFNVQAVSSILSAKSATTQLLALSERGICLSSTVQTAQLFCSTSPHTFLSAPWPSSKLNSNPSHFLSRTFLQLQEHEELQYSRITPGLWH